MYIQAHAMFFVINVLQSTFRKTVENNTYIDHVPSHQFSI